MDVRVRLWRKLSTEELMLLNCSVGEDSWESLGLQGDPTSPSSRRSVLDVHRKDWCWSWNSSTLATSCEELTHWKRPWHWEGLRAGGEGEDRGWDGWMASLTWWAWVWVSSGSWWWTRRPGVLRFMGLQRVGHDWTELKFAILLHWSFHPNQIINITFYIFIHPVYLLHFTQTRTHDAPPRPPPTTPSLCVLCPDPLECLHSQGFTQMLCFFCGAFFSPYSFNSATLSNLISPQHVSKLVH